MNVLELDLATFIEPRTREYVAASEGYLDHALSTAEPKMRQAIDKLKGREALFLKKRYLEAPVRWQKFLWFRIAAHHFDEKEPLEASCRLAERELIALDALRHPM